MEVEKICETCINPSSATPSHLKTYNISLLDQFIPPTYFSLVFYYSNQESHITTTDTMSKPSILLKQSLSETLSRFYPLAGKVKDDRSIDCNDDGAYYVEARASVSLLEYLKEPLLSMDKLFPGNIGLSVPGSYVIKIQETTFTCGGFSIAILVSHMVCDGTALSSFLKDWAATSCRSSKEMPYPYLDSSSLFIPHDAVSKQGASLYAIWGPFCKMMNLNAKRFVFSASAIASLKEKAISSGVKNPTRVEVVTALLSKCLLGTLKEKSGTEKSLGIGHGVNLRRRAVPQLPECSLGNFLWLAATRCTTTEAELGSLVCKIKEAIGKINGDFVKTLQGDEGYMKYSERVKETGEVLIGRPEVVPAGEVDYASFTSWCNFGFYEIDFGWGTPVWTSTYSSRRNVEFLFINTIILMDAKEEKGIEAWAYLVEEEVILLEKSEELLQYVSVDPSPHMMP